jgi:ABC-2 type transport system permease protein
MKNLLKYDYIYLLKTKKIIIFSAMFVLFSIISPLTARYLQEIIGYLVDDLALGDLIPDPSLTSAFIQYTSDLYEIVFTITMFVAVGIFIRDKSKGLRPLIYSKPINKTYYLLSKMISLVSILLFSITLGYLVFTYYTYALFDETMFTTGILVMLLYFLDIVFACSLAMFTAVHFKNYILSIVIAWVSFIGINLLSLIERMSIFSYFPGATRAVQNNLILGANVENVGYNILVTLLFISLFTVLSVIRVRNEEL